MNDIGSNMSYVYSVLSTTAYKHMCLILTTGYQQICHLKPCRNFNLCQTYNSGFQCLLTFCSGG